MKVEIGGWLLKGPKTKRVRKAAIQVAAQYETLNLYPLCKMSWKFWSHAERAWF